MVANRKGKKKDDLTAHGVVHKFQQTGGVVQRSQIQKMPDEDSSLPPYKYLIQNHEPPDSNLCLYFAYYHYMDGNVDKKEFESKAIKPYVELGIKHEEALKMYHDGNDPSVYQKFGLSEVSYDQALTGEKLIVAHVTKGHFYALRKYQDTWWNYDSYRQTKPSKIGDQEQAMAYLTKLDQPVWAHDTITTNP
ncbi:MAG: hypothetical protein HEQ35_26295 [Gloeotrichia echinulata IR180]